MTATVVLIGIAGIAASYFAACHNALKILSRRRLAELLEQRGREDRLARVVAEVPDLLLATGVARATAAMVLVLAGYRVFELAGVDAGWRRYGFAAALAVVLMGVFTVAVPVYWAAYRRERLLLWSIPVLHALRIALFPLTFPLRVIDPMVRRVSGVELHDEEDDLAEQVLDAVERHDEELTVDEAQRQMIEGVVEMSETTVAEIMTPRTDVEGLPEGLNLQEVQDAVMAAGHSRIPVYRESLDEIVGLLYVKDLIAFLNRPEAFELAAVWREPLLVPETKSVREMLAEFRRRQVHLAVVLDEYGGTAGLVTIEDILEEIVGEIHDEYEEKDEEPALEMDADGRRAVVDARMHVDVLNDAMNLDLPDDGDYETLAGFVFSKLGHIPVAGEAFEDCGCRFEVLKAERTRVVEVGVAVLEEA
ncbi:hemolysin family protein [Phycisphaera mikurensis]|uniref:Hypothetical membrane protein n=1 Tax=Phycisphaera mikurensis (strain NBRC 102666 / KCTC 22515 / FYK2301M01) TaxID=1142394 RepID=I0IEB9_PHYMF|nr:hemolysin family protein [Phycisphaera mikurensis]MBB6441407.1 CBS domain containing-hemolysin-like protein [Phycisphaera mikurensis]BAM03607.1 hypothetical membrane protein [Phycisphaera mikurensis NBRC 102666]